MRNFYFHQKFQDLNGLLLCASKKYMHCVFNQQCMLRTGEAHTMQVDRIASTLVSKDSRRA